MSFATEFDPRPISELARVSMAANSSLVEESLKKPTLSLSDFSLLISPAAASHLETLGQRARRVTQQ
ncbi:MAG TPA: hypothetical protein VHI52_10030, partial [Verrucomicrobiae bacterium]|nr:hypothetical protein [Verrucomicrobiae bacterium]